MKNYWRTTRGDQIISTILMTICILWALGVWKERLSAETIVVSMLTLLLCGIFVNISARLFNYFADKQDHK